MSARGIEACKGWFGTTTQKAMSYVVGAISLVAAVFTTAGAVVSTVLYTVFRGVFEGAPEFNIRAHLGVHMYVCVWFAAACSIAAFVVGAVCICCCCRGWRK